MMYSNWVEYFQVTTNYRSHSREGPDGPLVIAEAQMLGISPSNYRAFLQVLSEVPDTSAFRHIPEDKVRPLVSAYTCSLAFCVQEYEVKTISGITDQKLRNTWDQFGRRDEGFWVPLKTSNIDSLKDASDYRVEGLSIDTLSNAIYHVLVGTTQVWADDISNPLNETLPPPNFVGQGNSLLGAFTQAVWQESNTRDSIAGFFDQVAASFTNFMRTSPLTAAPENDQYAPTVFTTVTLVHVRWGWLTFPLSIMLVTHVFLALTIYQTKRRRVQTWKGARLPLLLASIDDEVRDAAKGGLRSRSGLEERVGEMRVRLNYDDKDSISFERVK
jgi:hypothetical protein